MTCTCYYVYAGVLCEPFSSFPAEICPGGHVTFTCVVLDSGGIGTTTWRVTPNGREQDCVLRHSEPLANEVSTCGPGRVFTASLTNKSGDKYTSILSVKSISDGLNGTRVECRDAYVVDVDMENICIISKAFFKFCS